MKKTLLGFIVSIFFVNISVAFAQWERTKGPEGGAISALGINGSMIFAGTPGGVYISENNGTSWRISDISIAAKNFFTTGNKTYCVTAEAVYLTTNNGVSWAKIDNGIPTTIVRNCITVKNQKIFVGTNDGIYISSDNGVSWVLSTTGLPNFKLIRGILAKDTCVFVTTFLTEFLKPQMMAVIGRLQQMEYLL